jgi:hypothetical protein
MTYRSGFPLLALALCVGCSATDSTSVANAKVRVISNDVAAAGSFPRSGELHVTKECTEYTRLAHGFCTITSSNIEEIEVGSRVYYTVASGPAILDSDVTLEPPGPGNNRAFGHVVLALAAGQGTVTFSGGYGKFSHFSGAVTVTRIGAPALKTWSWDGTYSFDPRD